MSTAVVVVVASFCVQFVTSRADDPNAEWVRSYHVRLYFVDPECIKDAFDVSFAEVAHIVGKVCVFACIAALFGRVWHILSRTLAVDLQTFTAVLFALLNADLRRAGEKISKSAVGGSIANLDAAVGVVSVSGKGKGKAAAAGGSGDGDGDAAEDEGDGDAGAKKKKKGEDDDDDEDDEAGEDDGNIRLGTRKPVKGYDDDKDDGEDEESGSSSSSDDDALVDEALKEVESGTGATAATPKRASHAAQAEQEGVKRVSVPPTIAKHKLFGDCLYSEDEAWVEVVVNFPPSARKVMMLQTAERAVQRALVRQTKGVSRCFVASHQVRAILHGPCAARAYLM